MAKDRARVKKAAAPRKRLARGESGSESDDAFLVEDDSTSRQPAKDDDAAYLSPEVRALMAQMEARSGGGTNAKRPYYARPKSVAKEDEAEDEEPETTPKIFYASRTHSQLSQFVAELKKTEFGRHISVDDEEEGAQVRSVSLGSRKQMCINEKVQALGQRAGAEAMNERCQELMKAKVGSKSNRCEFLPPSDETGHALMLDYRDRALAEVQDIEELVELGKEMHTCPYFGARTSARQAQVSR